MNENTKKENNTSHSYKPHVFISTGDLNGIGPEIILNTISQPELLDICVPVVFSSQKVITYFKKNLELENFNFFPAKDLSQINPKKVNVFITYDQEINIQPGTRDKNLRSFAILSLKKALESVRAKKDSILLTGPIDKELMYGEDFPFKGHTECLERVYQTETLMMMVDQELNLRVGLATEHTPIAQVAEKLNAEKLEKKIKIFYRSLQRDFLINRPKIAVLGLNPHAGDHGTIGNEEQNIIIPVIEKLKNEFSYIFGPFGADGFFGSGEYRKYDGILAMYHDQGLIPFKTLSFDRGVNFTAGIPIIRTSPDHGPAFSIAGKKASNHTSFMNALFLGLDILKNRNTFDTMHKNPLPKLTVENSDAE
ncbi:MAG: 4-hydroxythreonine-4-phosphate dehydrogenase PdxA [Bacteroidia bacterium]|nr:4-hydroxythreonine-4-phosphate dehydrogenase PdxA [Bacteroidia bacterium]